MILSRRGMRRVQIIIQGKIAKKKSQALDHTAADSQHNVNQQQLPVFSPPNPTLKGLIWTFHFPGVLSGSQLALMGVV